MLGTDHWALRWPVVLPAAAIVELFGRSREALMWPGIVTLAALVAVTFWSTRAVFGRAAAMVAGAALLTTSEILIAGTRLGADVIEALFWTASAWTLVFAARNPSPRTAWLVGCGALGGLAWAVRETSGSLFVLLALGFAIRIVPWRGMAWVALGTAAVLLPEQIMLWAASGDPIYRLHVDLRHIEVPSTNLRGLVAGGGGAALNTAIAARWLGVGPVHVHWALDPWLNLFLNGRYGLDFLLAAVCVVTARRRGLPWRALAALTVAAALHIVWVTYVVATDPKPRMFMPSIVAGCVILGVAAPHLWHGAGRWWLGAAAAAKLVLLLISIDLTASSNARFEGLSAAALARVRGDVHASRWTISTLDLAPCDVRLQLRAGLPPVGGYWLAVAKRGDPHGDATPDPRLRWARVTSVVPAAPPVTLRLAGALLPGDATLGGLLRPTPPSATIWRRLPDGAQPR